MEYIAVLIGFCLTLVLVIINFQIAKKIGSANEQLLKYKDQRINLFQDILAGIRQIKYLNWEEKFMKKILSIRKNEFFYLKIKKYLDAFCVFFWATLTIIISTIIFCLNEHFENESVKSLNVFTAIALFNILLVPLNSLPWTIGGMITGKVSFKRISQFYNGKEMKNSLGNIAINLLG
jgi:ATP-binding cassette subfamily C (CFTR/MRP) protein 10